ncbi:hypothetical protein BDN70DRAFT_881320 [Pholiota conissans]|uniref:Uncharacterized protein n=1 Tax=Pholiota conissans TaxID=109636 RepID=A0A9P6CZ49_9AGAR|nr:hypothetical protein BDN70DRAFT_881320 [Pholiota conissans]
MVQNLQTDRLRTLQRPSLHTRMFRREDMRGHLRWKCDPAPFLPLTLARTPGSFHPQAQEPSHAAPLLRRRFVASPRRRHRPHGLALSFASSKPSRPLFPHLRIDVPVCHHTTLLLPWSYAAAPPRIPPPYVQPCLSVSSALIMLQTRSHTNVHSPSSSITVPALNLLM